MDFNTHVSEDHVRGERIRRRYILPERQGWNVVLGVQFPVVRLVDSQEVGVIKVFSQPLDVVVRSRYSKLRESLDRPVGTSREFQIGSGE